VSVERDKLKDFALRLIVTLTAFIASIGSVVIFSQLRQIDNVPILSGHTTSNPASPAPTIPTRQPQKSTVESKIVEIAEGFVVKEGYTDLIAPHTGPVYYEPGEHGMNYVELEKRRRNTLERKAYATYRWKRGKRVFWTVIFPYTHLLGARYQGLGRAVTMEEDKFNFVREVHLERRDVRLAKLKKNL
jgi:hypothetical protein